MSPDATVTHVIAALAIVIATAHALGAAARRLRQPAVIGQLFAGIALGPSLLGLAPGHMYENLFPLQIRPVLTAVAQLALVLFLFAVGYELDLGLLRGRRAVWAVALGGFAIPMLTGIATALFFRRGFAAVNGGNPVDATFVLFLAVALSITAVPVLAAVIRDQGLSGTVAGAVAMAAAGLVDVLSWPVLAFVLVGGEHGSVASWAVRIALLALYVLVMVFVVRPLLVWWKRRPGTLVADDVPVAVAVALGSAWATNALGLHVIFGALLAGVIMPRQPDGVPDSRLLGPLQETGGLLLPVFFAVSGLAVDLRGLHPSDGLVLLLLCAVATVSKVGAGTLSARAVRSSWPDAVVTGLLLNTRGLTELIVLDVGLRAGVIGSRLYTLLVVMALFTTAATGPSLGLLRRIRGARTVSDASAAMGDPEPAPRQ
ncbi:cation:proton antiporter [Actinacidiphila sp. ITFR-21]|uniref:cation:proton antiporter n=1 Tax=Actinacidiphila sp. ITFR-21 TaxID=3075199 RepID=UPI0028893A91|nr:cation:proton antiporter [Streptomyces sp. ITFR-21]WNI16429.1 cation:proton antiporter [Streptomyces sp. ITFR-21]